MSFEMGQVRAQTADRGMEPGVSSFHPANSSNFPYRLLSPNGQFQDASKSPMSLQPLTSSFCSQVTFLSGRSHFKITIVRMYI